MSTQPIIAAAESVSKRFGATQALDGVSIELRRGEVHALVGENGAGKSTLIKIFGGIHQPDSGATLISGSVRQFPSPSDALAAGIAVIPQEITLVPALSVAENVLLGLLPTRRFAAVLPGVDRDALRQRASARLARLNYAPDLAQPVERLSYAERQLVAIAKALHDDLGVLILDEPTASLEHREVERLFDVIETLKRQGVAIVYVSHRLDEVEALADVCTVLRDGRVVDVAQREDLSRERMIRLMTGRDLEELHRAHDLEPGAPLLRFDGPESTDVGTFEVRQREVAGVAGLLGSGTTAFLKRIFGAGRSKTEIGTSRGMMYVTAPAQAINAGIGLVPGERSEGLIMQLTVRENIALPNLGRLSQVWRLDNREITKLVDRLIDAVDIRPRNPDLPVHSLSGGNQQKVIFARWLAGHIDLLLLDEPTHGIDIGAKVGIHRLIRRFVEDGGGVVFASSEMNEVMALSDNVLAMRHGTFVARIARDGDYTERALREALGG